MSILRRIIDWFIKPKFKIHFIRAKVNNQWVCVYTGKDWNKPNLLVMENDQQQIGYQHE